MIKGGKKGYKCNPAISYTMDEERYLLPKYFEILDGHRTAHYLDCKQVPVIFTRSQSIDELWAIHDKALRAMNVKNTTPPLSLLDLKIELAERLFQACCLCEHRCMVNRRKAM